MRITSRLPEFCGLLLLIVLLCGAPLRAQILQVIVTSDVHYGLERSFRGTKSVSSREVNEAMIEKMNLLPQVTLPVDGGVNEGNIVGGIDEIIVTGDIANRAEPPVQSAALSWSQFTHDYVDRVTLTDRNAQKSGLLLIAGNHDVSNAIGYPRPMSPPTDSTSMVNIRSMMVGGERQPGRFNFEREKTHYARDIAGIRFEFVSIWPDSSERVWMAEDLGKVGSRTPVFLFTHDEPEVESKHFTNPNGMHDVNAADRFENVLLEAFKDGSGRISDPSTIEQRGFASFVKSRPNIVAYFHGNDHRCRFYVYQGPDTTIALNTFDVDSPMKGVVSRADETQLSFLLASIDTDGLRMTVRQCLWNVGPSIVFGASKTVSIAPR